MKFFIRPQGRALNPIDQDSHCIDTRQLHRPATIRLLVGATTDAQSLHNQHK